MRYVTNYVTYLKKVMDKKSPILFKACREGDLDMVKKLLDEGMDVNIRDNHRWTLLMEASVFGQLDVIDELFNRGADINDVEEYNSSALVLVARNSRDIRVVKKLLDHGADYDIKGKYGKKMMDHLPKYDKVEIEEYISCDIKPACK